MGRLDDVISGTTSKPDADPSSTETSRAGDGAVGAPGQASAAPGSGAQDVTSRDLPSHDLGAELGAGLGAGLGAPQDDVVAEAAHSSATDHPAADDDLLASVTSMPATSDIDHTFDQLVTSVDLFDVPAFDLGDTT